MMMMMMRNINCSTPAAKTAEIMSRYRPIAPKPPISSSSSSSPPKTEHHHLMFDQNTNQEPPFLRNLWQQSRPSRTRKRGGIRTTSISPITFKRTSSSSRPTNNNNTLHHHQWQSVVGSNNGSLVTLPLLPSCPRLGDNAVLVDDCDEGKVVDLSGIKAEISEENGMGMVLQLQGPVVESGNNGSVISPKPVRPVGSSVHVGCIDTVVISEDDPKSIHTAADPQVPKKAEDVEEEVESEPLPAIVSDSNHKVRLTNSAYKEMVGQPKCSWLDSMVLAADHHGRSGTGPCSRIGGEVMLRLSDFNVPVEAKGFSCWVRIEWGNVGDKKCVNVFCDVNRLVCESKDYMFAWRFHTGNSESSDV